MKKRIGILMGIVLNVHTVLDRMDILALLILSIHEHRISFHLFVSSDFFINVLRFSICSSFTYWVKFIPRWLVLLMLL